MTELSKEKMMTVKEIMEATGVPKQTLVDCVNRIYPSKMQHGKMTYFDEVEVANISIELKRASNIKSTGTRTVGMTELEKKLKVAEAIKILSDDISELQSQLENAKPKIEFYDTVADSKDAIPMDEVAKILECRMGRNKLFSFLRSKGILRDNNEPYQKYIDRKYFRLVMQQFTKPSGEVKITSKTLVYPKGVEYINKLLRSN